MTLETVVDGKHMRVGYTTGSCVVAGLEAAIRSLDTNETVEAVRIAIPAGMELSIDVLEIQRTSEKVTYSVIKDSGDDPDITDGIEIRVTVEWTKTGKIEWKRGVGVGVFTGEGLFQKAGELAVNPVPRREIMKRLEAHRGEGIAFRIDIPEGESIARRTFNPKLGIRGGLSILGTSGLVKPMSKDAYVATVDLELKRWRRLKKEVLYLTPGNYGERYVQKFDEDAAVVKVSNYFGDALKLAADYGFKHIVLLGHIGKMAKLSIGIFQTHSAVADGRMEAIAYYLFKAGAKREVVELAEAQTTAEQAIRWARSCGYGDILGEMEKGIADRAATYVGREDLKIEARIYTMEDLT